MQARHSQPHIRPWFRVARFHVVWLRAGAALALVLVLAACTKSGQFDPTEIFASDLFDTKKKISGQRESVFPNGVPGTSTGVPADLVQGYQPPDQAEAGSQAFGGAPGQADNSAAGSAAKTADSTKPKPKPKSTAARAPRSQDPAPVGAARTGPTRISVGPKPAAPPPASAPAASSASSQSDWPAPPPTSPVQTRWPDPSAGAPAQKQTAQPAQSVWPNPPATSAQ